MPRMLYLWLDNRSCCYRRMTSQSTAYASSCVTLTAPTASDEKWGLILYRPAGSIT